MSMTVLTIGTGQHGGITRKADNHCGSETLVVKQLNPASNGFEYGGMSSEGVLGEYQPLKFDTEEKAQAFLDAKSHLGDTNIRYQIKPRYFTTPDGDLIDLESMRNPPNEVINGWLDAWRDFSRWRYYNTRVQDLETAQRLLQEAEDEFTSLDFEIKEIQSTGPARISLGRVSAQFVRIPLDDGGEDGGVQKRKFDTVRQKSPRKGERLKQALPGYLDEDSEEVPVDHRYRGFRF